MTIINYELAPQLKMKNKNKYELVDNYVINFATFIFFKVTEDDNKNLLMKLISRSS